MGKKRRRLRPAKGHDGRTLRFLRDIRAHTPFVEMVFLLVALWLIFSGGVFMAERGAEDTSITSYGRALYWGIAAFSTAGIADAPRTGLAQLIGGGWIVLGSMLFFGAIVATVTTYFMRPLHRPAKQIVDTIEYNLERLDDLSIDELDLLKETADSLILHMERVKKAHPDGEADKG
jgi:voltage-gated potassium channel